MGGLERVRAKLAAHLVLELQRERVEVHGYGADLLGADDKQEPALVGVDLDVVGGQTHHFPFPCCERSSLAASVTFLVDGNQGRTIHFWPFSPIVSSTPMGHSSHSPSRPSVTRATPTLCGSVAVAMSSWVRPSPRQDEQRMVLTSKSPG